MTWNALDSSAYAPATRPRTFSGYFYGLFFFFGQIILDIGGLRRIFDYKPYKGNPKWFLTIPLPRPHPAEWGDLLNGGHGHKAPL